MKIKLTDKAGDIPLASFLAQGWTPETLVAHGYAAEQKEPAKPKAPDTWKPGKSYGSLGPATPDALLPNAFGLTHTDQVRELWKQVSPPSLYANGYSFEQQIIFAAEAMAAGGVK